MNKDKPTGATNEKDDTEAEATFSDVSEPEDEQSEVFELGQELSSNINERFILASQQAVTTVIQSPRKFKEPEKIPSRTLDPIPKNNIVQPSFRNYILIGSYNGCYGDGIKFLNFVGDSPYQIEDAESADIQGCNYVQKNVFNRFDGTGFFLTIYQLLNDDKFSKHVNSLANDSECVLYMFDLMNATSSLQNLDQIYMKLKLANANILPFLVGINYERFDEQNSEIKEATIRKARNTATKMKAGLVFVSLVNGTNVDELFEVSLSLSRGIYVLTPAKTSGSLLEFHNLIEQVKVHYRR
jgi:hypothetical protein